MTIGLYNIPQAYLHVVADLGADYVQSYDISHPVDTWRGMPKAHIETKRYLDAAQRCGLKVLTETPRAWYDDDIYTQSSVVARDYFIATVSNHPALLAFYLADEPEVEKLSRSTYRIIKRACQEIAPFIPVRVATMRWRSHWFGYPYPADQYMCSNYWITRWHPLPLGTGGRFVHWMWNSLKRKYDVPITSTGTNTISHRPCVIPIIQTHDADLWWSASGPYSRGIISRILNRNGYREPTMDEMKRQVDKARKISSEIWFWGFHASEQAFPYKITDKAQQKRAREIIRHAKGI